MSKTNGGQPKPDKASDAKIERRVQVILQLKLDGAEPWNILQYCAEKQALAEEPWVRATGQKPLCERQLREYMARADALMSEACMKHAQNAIHLHIGQRRGLYARALEDGDFRTALAVLQDLAQLADLYPAPKKQSIDLTAKVSHGFEDLTDDEIEAELLRLEGLRTPEADPGGQASPA